jgi:hypothetical protein
MDVSFQERNVSIAVRGVREAVFGVARSSATRSVAFCEAEQPVAGPCCPFTPLRLRHVPLAALRRGYTTLPCVWKGDGTGGRDGKGRITRRTKIEKYACDEAHGNRTGGRPSGAGFDAEGSTAL